MLADDGEVRPCQGKRARRIRWYSYRRRWYPSEWKNPITYPVIVRVSRYYDRLEDYSRYGMALLWRWLPFDQAGRPWVMNPPRWRRCAATRRSAVDSITCGGRPLAAHGRHSVRHITSASTQRVTTARPGDSAPQDSQRWPQGQCSVQCGSGAIVRL